jgi:hypothetical protein
MYVRQAIESPTSTTQVEPTPGISGFLGVVTAHQPHVAALV